MILDSTGHDHSRRAPQEIPSVDVQNFNDLAFLGEDAYLYIPQSLAKAGAVVKDRAVKLAADYFWPGRQQ